jgi:hypothetical protein
LRPGYPANALRSRGCGFGRRRGFGRSRSWRRFRGSRRRIAHRRRSGRRGCRCSIERCRERLELADLRREIERRDRLRRRRSIELGFERSYRRKYRLRGRCEIGRDLRIECGLIHDDYSLPNEYSSKSAAQVLHVASILDHEISKRHTERVALQFRNNDLPITCAQSRARTKTQPLGGAPPRGGRWSHGQKPERSAKLHAIQRQSSSREPPPSRGSRCRRLLTGLDRERKKPAPKMLATMDETRAC